MTLATSIADEFGSKWKVKGGDPAARVTNRLTRAGYQTIVLPFLTLATGRLVEPVEWPQDILARTRLADCIAAAKG